VAAPNEALLDSGAKRNFILEVFVRASGISTHKVDKPLQNILTNGSTVRCDTVVKSMLSVDGWTQPGHLLHVIL
jgi:hypothetical protein